MDNKELWQPKRRIEVQYQKALHQITDLLNESMVGLTDPFDIIAKIKGILQSASFLRFAEATASKMVTQLLVDSAKTWREAASQSSQGRVIYEALRKELNGPVGGAVAHLIQGNAALIKSMPLDIAEEATKYIGEQALAGKRASAISDDLLAQVPSMSRNKANLIARTEVSKTSTALTQARSENLGISAYVWRTSEDGRVRSSHRHMDGVIVFWSDPPSPERLIGQKNPPPPYHAGNIYNCRCYPEPIVTLDALSWPHKVYRNGSITQITRKQFENLVA